MMPKYWRIFMFQQFEDNYSGDYILASHSARIVLLFAFMFLVAGIRPLQAHPHVFVEAGMEVVLNDNGEFTELRHVWRFDELFSATVLIDYDMNTNGKLETEEIEAVTKIVKESIAEYDFYTAIRMAGTPIEFYEPEKLNAYFEGDQMVMFFSVETENPVPFAGKGLRISASDTSYYVAFEFSPDTVKVVNGSNACSIDVIYPDFDSLYASNAEMLTEAFFNNPDKPDLGDEFYSWATIAC